MSTKVLETQIADLTQSIAKRKRLAEGFQGVQRQEYDRVTAGEEATLSRLKTKLSAFSPKDSPPPGKKE